MNVTSKHKVETLSIGGEFSNMELLVGYDVVTVHNPIRIEEGHGRHFLNEDEESIELTSVEVVINGNGIDILSKLDLRQKRTIIDELENY